MASESCFDNNSDSEEGEPEEVSGVRISYNLDDWLHFNIEPEVSLFTNSFNVYIIMTSCMVIFIHADGHACVGSASEVALAVPASHAESFQTHDTGRRSEQKAGICRYKVSRLYWVFK